MSPGSRKTPSRPSGAARGLPIRCKARSPRPASTLAFPERLPDLFDLFHMIDVMPGDHLHHPLDGFLSPLLVHAPPLPLVRGERFKERDVLLPHLDKKIEFSPAVGRIIPEVVRPLVLVVRLDRASRFGD